MDAFDPRWRPLLEQVRPRPWPGLGPGRPATTGVMEEAHDFVAMCQEWASGQP